MGRFHIPTDKAKSAPDCFDPRTNAVEVENGDIYIHTSV